jgi:hypothetical protein
MAGGGACVIVALLQRWNMQGMNPGVEGSLTAIVVGLALALFEGLSFETVLKHSVPIFAIECVALKVVDAQVFAVLGIELLLFGFLGLILRRAPAAPVSRRGLAPSHVGRGSASGSPSPTAAQSASGSRIPRPAVADHDTWPLRA